MLRLHIEQQPAKLTLSITDPAITIHTQPARLEIHTEPAVVEIRQSQGELVIDQSPCCASYGLKPITQLNRELAQKSRQAALETIAQIATDGDRMARIESGENVIAALAVEAGTPEPVEVVLKSIARPYIRYYPHPTEYQVQPGQYNAQYLHGTLDVQLNRGEVRVSMAQYQSIRMWTTGTMDLSV